ncbi:MAG: family 78 glycoside hydrolase catalytic domain [Cyclobacteriaceae bacterium]
MRLIFCYLIIVLSSSCAVKERQLSEVSFFDHLSARWITDSIALPISDSLHYHQRRSPLFRKNFPADKEVSKATMIITAAGYFKATINGQSVGNGELEPAWTDYSKRIYYSEYNVTSLIRPGPNCIGVKLGNGFYNPLPLRKWGSRNLRKDTYVGKPTFIAKLRIDYKDGETQEIVSDQSWSYSFGPVVKNSVYIGVEYDATKEIQGWNQPTFDDRSWVSAKLAMPPEGKLKKTFFPPVAITREVRPQSISVMNSNKWLVDMGENFTGTYRARFRGNIGDTITLRFGERLHPDGTLNPMTSVIGQIKHKGVGGPGAPDIAWQTDSYIIGSEDAAWFQPEFTYHVYRYMEISGLREKPQMSDVTGLVMHSDVKRDNSFESSSALLNDIQGAIRRTFLTNLVSVQSDCPAREKFGYGGDINATSEAFIYNFDMAAFYRKTVYDWVDAMNDSSFVDTAPYVGIRYCGLSWESAFLITQYYLLLYYGDEQFVREMYDLNKSWMAKVQRIHPNGIVDKGLSDHESLEPVPVQLTGTAHYLQCARIMQTFAEIVGDELGSQKYEELARGIEGWLRAEYWEKPTLGNINRQTLFATLLYYGIVPSDQIEAGRDSLLSAITHGPARHFNTGIFGTKYILESFSKYDSPGAVFEIVNSTQYPGWGHMIDRGATTLWETWAESDNIYSNNHPMFGSVSEWFYKWLGGIRPDPNNPGFKNFFIQPYIPKGLDRLSCNYDSPYGTIVSEWEVTSLAHRRYHFVIPEGSQAEVVLVKRESDHIEIKKNQVKQRSQQVKGLELGKFRLEAGDYEVNVYPGSE